MYLLPAFQVRVGAYLKFTVGTLIYTDTTQTAQPVNVIIGATVGVAVVVVLIIAVVVIVAPLLTYWSRANKTRTKG